MVLQPTWSRSPLSRFAGLSRVLQHPGATLPTVQYFPTSPGYDNLINRPGLLPTHNKNYKTTEAPEGNTVPLGHIELYQLGIPHRAKWCLSVVWAFGGEEWLSGSFRSSFNALLLTSTAARWPTRRGGPRPILIRPDGVQAIFRGVDAPEILCRVLPWRKTN